MKINEACTYMGAYTGAAVAAGGSSVLPMFCVVIGDSDIMGSCLGSALGGAILFVAAGTAAGACAGKIAGVAIEIISNSIRK